VLINGFVALVKLNDIVGRIEDISFCPALLVLCVASVLVYPLQLTSMKLSSSSLWFRHANEMSSICVKGLS